MNVSRRSTLFLLLLGVILGASGCGGSTGNVEGVVFVQGKPLPHGVIAFHFDTAGTSEPIRAEVRDGRYAARNLPLGPARISIAAIYSEPGPAPAAGGEEDAAPPPPTLAASVAVPPKYNDAGTSGLSCTVKSGTQKKDFNLTP